jgi:hypothetical protein
MNFRYPPSQRQPPRDADQLLNNLKQVRQRLENRDAWTTRFMARDGNDMPVANPTFSAAAKWCVIGHIYAVQGCYDPMTRSYLESLLPTEYHSALDQFNDYTSYEDVCALVDHGIGILERTILGEYHAPRI